MSSEAKPARIDPLSKLADLDDFQVASKPVAGRRPFADAHREEAEAAGFVSRGPVTSVRSAAAAPKVEQRRYRTGRNKQLSLKVTEDTAQRFTAIADRERLVLGELLERLLDAYEGDRKKKAS